jgi:hypothetical protein
MRNNLGFIGILMTIMSCSTASENNILREDFSAYSPMNVGDSLVYRNWPVYQSDSLIIQRCLGQVFKGTHVYFEYETYYSGNLTSTQGRDTGFSRKSNDGDVYAYIDGKDSLVWDFHTSSSLTKKYFSYTTSLGKFDSCVSFTFGHSFPDWICQVIYAPGIGEIYSVNPKDTSNYQTLIYAKINNVIWK